MTKEETFEDMLQKALKDGKDNNREMKKVMRRKLKTIDSSQLLRIKEISTKTRKSTMKNNNSF